MLHVYHIGWVQLLEYDSVFKYKYKMVDSNASTLKYKCIKIQIHWKEFQIPFSNTFQILFVFRT